MSWIAYINGNLLELSTASPIAQTKQVNDIARLDNRQSNFTNKFIAPLVANNIKAMEFVYFVGSQSNVPYQKNEFTLFDADSGECLIYKGWAVVSQSTDKGYEIHVYDGIIDFYRTIENKTLTDVDITGLDHLKNLQNVIDSFTQVLPYKYIIADYNGKNTESLGVSPSIINLAINADYQVPSARVSFIWNRIFDFAGFTYSGSYFETTDFINLFMTFPKPVPFLVPTVEEITRQTSLITTNVVQEPSGEYVTYYGSILLPDPFDNNYVAGTYQLKVSGTFDNILQNSGVCNFQIRDSSNNVIQSGTLDGGNDESILVSISVGYVIIIYSQISGLVSSVVNHPLTGSITTSIDLVLGYDADFSEALIDFKATDFVNEIMQRGGLTMFKDKYQKHIEFLTLREILESLEVIDWSDKNPIKLTEKYIYGNYAKKNNFKYRYNEDNDKHNDGFITIENDNLKDETTVINSKIYSPDKSAFPFFGYCKEIFRFWNKETKDDLTIEYKELNGRYYFLREKEFISPFPLTIGSKNLYQHDYISSFPVADYSNLKFTEIIRNNYSSIASVLNKAKVIETNFYLKASDLAAFDFKKLIYIEQFSSYYVVNKILNFVKEKYTKVELIEVDRFQILGDIEPIEPSFIGINLIDADGCTVTITFTTDAVFPCNIRLVGIGNTFGGSVPGDIMDQTFICNSNILTFDVANGGDWNFNLEIVGTSPLVRSNTDGVTVTGCTAKFITVTSYDQLPNNGMKIYFTTNLQFPFDMALRGESLYPSFQFFQFNPQASDENYFIVQNVPGYYWTFTISSGGVTSNTF